MFLHRKKERLDILDEDLTFRILVDLTAIRIDVMCFYTGELTCRRGFFHFFKREFIEFIGIGGATILTCVCDLTFRRGCRRNSHYAFIPDMWLHFLIATGADMLMCSTVAGIDPCAILMLMDDLSLFSRKDHLLHFLQHIERDRCAAAILGIIDIAIHIHSKSTDGRFLCNGSADDARLCIQGQTFRKRECFRRI